MRWDDSLAGMSKRLLQWNLDIVDFEIVEILVIVDKEMLPISILLSKIPWYSGFLWNSGQFDADGRVHYIKVSLYQPISAFIRPFNVVTHLGPSREVDTSL